MPNKLKAGHLYISNYEWIETYDFNGDLVEFGEGEPVLFLYHTENEGYVFLYKDKKITWCGPDTTQSIRWAANNDYHSWWDDL